MFRAGVVALNAITLVVLVLVLAAGGSRLFLVAAASSLAGLVLAVLRPWFVGRTRPGGGGGR
jgi:hypothetical protein